MLRLCEDGHYEICYEGNVCPCCDLKNDMQGEIDDLTTKVDDLEDRLAEL